jgi:hypothetical protein
MLKGTLRESKNMRVDRYPVENVFVHAPELAEQIDPVLKQLDT